jgi:PKD repeat protein
MNSKLDKSIRTNKIGTENRHSFRLKMLFALLIISLVVGSVIIPFASAESDPLPQLHIIEGTVFHADGVTQADEGTEVNISVAGGTPITVYTGIGSKPNGDYIAAVNGFDGDEMTVEATDGTHYGKTVVTLSGDMDVNVIFDNIDPVAEANGDYSGTEGVPLSLSSVGSNDPDGTIVSYDWDFGDGSAHGTDANPSHTYADAVGSPYTVTLTVTDNDGATDSDTATVTINTHDVQNLPPVAEANGPYSGTEGVPLSLSSVGSNDPDGTIVSYDWDFGDGSAHGTDENPSHTYADAVGSPYTVTLTVTDNDGATDTACTIATISEDDVSIPEFPTVALPVLSILGLMFIMSRRKERDS